MNLFENKTVSVDNVTSSSSEKKVGFAKFEIKSITAAEAVNDYGTRRIDFNMETEDGFKTKYSVFLSDQVRTTKAGDKFLWVDKFGNVSIYTATPETQENTYHEGEYTFLAEGARKAFVGEEDLMIVLNAILNQTLKVAGKRIQNELRLSEDVIKGLFNANAEVLKAVNDQFIGKAVGGLLILKNSGDNQYTELFKYLAKSWSNDLEGFFTKKVSKELDNDPKYSAIKDHHEWLVQPLGTFTKLNSRNNEGVATVTDAPSNDLPF